jgi:hypothetical protein
MKCRSHAWDHGFYTTPKIMDYIQPETMNYTQPRIMNYTQMARYYIYKEIRKPCFIKNKWISSSTAVWGTFSKER